MKAIASSIVTLVFGLLQAVSAPGQAADPPAQDPLKIDAFTGFIHLVDKPELAYPKEALQQHIEGGVELELTVSPQGDVVGERALWGPSALQQATMDAFKKVEYIPFRRDGEPSVALVRVLVVYEKDQATISTESEQGPEYSGYAGSKAPQCIGCGNFGLGTGAKGRQIGNIEIISDAQGVDFGPYVHRVAHDVRQNWYKAIPESAQQRYGNPVIEFAITKDGKVGGMKLVSPSGDIPLDRAAWASIVTSDPFSPLPSVFRGQYLALRCHFYYNPIKEELAPVNPTTSPPVVK